MSLPTVPTKARGRARDTAADRPEPARDDVLVDIRDLKVHYALRGNFVARLFGTSSGSVKAVDGVSLTLHRGEVLGVVGESGSGKTTLGRALLALVPATSGSIRYAGAELTGLSESKFRPMRRRLQMVFQDPHASLNPSMNLLAAVGHPLRIHRVTSDAKEIERLVAAALERVGLAPVEQFLYKYPSDLSGGQKQRAVIARAIILGPQLLVADEPVSMLDMSVRAKILELMLDLKRDLELTYVYITHDLATAKFFCDRIAIMYLGRIVEIGPAAQIYADPKHPYTRALLRAIPEPDPRRSVPRDLPRGEVPDAVSPPLGCSFHPRCPVAFAPCGWESRDLRALLENRWVRLGEAAYDAERPVVGDLEVLAEPAQQARLPAGRGHSGADVAALLERIRADESDDPFWRGVRSITVDGDAAVVGWHDGIDPIGYQVGPVQVACLYYNDEVAALAPAYGKAPNR